MDEVASPSPGQPYGTRNLVHYLLQGGRSTRQLFMQDELAVFGDPQTVTFAGVPYLNFLPIAEKLL